jgi:hypothetical protein
MISAEFPKGFTVQRIGVTAAMAISHLPAPEIAKYFREHPEIADALMGSRTTTIYSLVFHRGKGQRLQGWFTRDANHEFVREFSRLADAATDHLLFSLGKGRWTLSRINE